ncbi:MAG: hypothetical protein LDLANPLL_00319 [Turneriella sp.]|nr:hypothetical protein [Turneriella sp.]
MPADIPPNPTQTESEILDFFSERNFERSRRFGNGAYSPEHLKNFLSSLGNPQFSYKTIHVAGTVGKGSVTTYLSRALSCMGYKTGAYFSPHFVSLRERFTINGEPIEEEYLRRLWDTLKTEDALRNLSFFDAMTALAFLYFQKEKCDWAVVETGLGGRLDSTNNLHAEFAVVSRVDLDHQNILGGTLESIAYEKAGIFHKKQRAYTLLQNGRVITTLKNYSNEVGAYLSVIDTSAKNFIEENRALVKEILEREFSLDLKKNTGIEAELQKPIFGRLTLLRKKPRVFFDGGHNAVAMRALSTFVNSCEESCCRIFLNTMLERNLQELSHILKEEIQKHLELFFFPMQAKNYYTSPPNSSLKVASDSEIKLFLEKEGMLNLFTGSMGIYKELRVRFSL